MNALRISTEKRELDIPLIHRFLSNESYWSQGISMGTVQRSIAGSLCFGGYLNDQQVAFARVVTDYATFAYLADVFVIAEQRNKGYARALLHAIFAHPRLQDIRRFMLTTADAREFYAKFGFSPFTHPERLMERRFDGNELSSLSI